MQMESVAASAGRATCRAASRMAWSIALPSLRLRLMFSISTVASSTSIPMTSDRPPSVIRLKVCPAIFSPRIPTRMLIGIEKPTMIVLLQLPTKASTISATSPAAMQASRTTPLTAARTNFD